LRATPEAGGVVRYRAEAGVVGRIVQCDGRWCRFDVGQRSGWIAQADLFGVRPGEAVE
jgi:SH3-like domain-containing protein